MIFDLLQEDAHYAAAYDMENAIADKKPSVLDQLKEKFTGKNHREKMLDDVSL